MYKRQALGDPPTADETRKAWQTFIRRHRIRHQSIRRIMILGIAAAVIALALVFQPLLQPEQQEVEVLSLIHISFSASALHYTICSLDDGEQKDQRHSPEVQKADLTNLIIDKAQMGLGCVNSWGALPLPQYMLPYGDYEFTFILTPVKHQIEIE